MKNLIGLDKGNAEKLANELNLLLANYQLYYQNLRGFHWNIKGDQFFELHAKFEELYTDAQTSIDEIAERILTLGVTPLHTFSSYLKVTKIEEQKDLSDGKSTVNATLEALQTIIAQEREIMELASKTNDEGTATLISDYITKQEKVVWMLGAYLK
ncbi:MAG: DNA starvation/stationary phase protection protein [Chitinophagales bacterium]